MTPAIFHCLHSQFPSVVSGTINNGGLERSTGMTVSCAQLGFHEWEAGPDYAQLCENGAGGHRVFFSSRPTHGL